LARRATRGERRNKQSAAPGHTQQQPGFQQAAYQQPQYQQGAYQQPQYQQPRPQQQAQEWAPFDNAAPPASNGAPRRELDPAPSDRGGDGDWDYDNSGW